MKTRAFIISSAVSTVLQSLYIIGISLLSMLILPSMMQSLNIDPNGGPPPGFSNFMWVSTSLGCLGVLLAPVAYVGTGILYTWLHHREDQPVTAEQGAIGGAAAAATARFTTGLIQGVFSLLMSSVVYQNIASQIGPLPGGPSTGMPFIYGIGMFSGMVGGIVGACFGALLAAALGAIGGALAGAIFK